ncbi:unnamed protein product [Psylliodes chrysocephalus]|uniref:Uncharacterized protein n=1 Tax=Psylliodes chrysocephalus TaxID=3402493 RepID=A0A9P0D6H4_9CUCU|nr:unnamed protein product [Psylliodes chrysocephala]
MTLSNQSIVPNKFQRHLQQHHKHVVQKPAGYFKGLLQEHTKASRKMLNRVKISDRALIASFKVSELIVRNKEGHTIRETLLLLACKEIVNTMFGPEAAEEVSKITLSYEPVKR